MKIPILSLVGFTGKRLLTIRLTHIDTLRYNRSLFFFIDDYESCTYTQFLQYVSFTYV